MSVPLRIAMFNLENLDDKPEDRLYPESDHAPIVAELEI
jgi:hypothetical protein